MASAVADETVRSTPAEARTHLAALPLTHGKVVFAARVMGCSHPQRRGAEVTENVPLPCPG